MFYTIEERESINRQNLGVAVRFDDWSSNNGLDVTWGCKSSLLSLVLSMKEKCSDFITSHVKKKHNVMAIAWPSSSTQDAATRS